MLVLSRRPEQRIDFPSLGITVEVLRVSGKNVRLGVTAPDNVRIVRNEIAGALDPNCDATHGVDSSTLHGIRNRLNAAVLGLHLLRRQSESGTCEAVEDTFQKILYELGTLESEFCGLSGRARTEASSSRRQILLVEDDRNEAELLAGFLRTYNFSVATAKDGSAAIDYLSHHPRPDFVLLDMRMPGMDGPQTIDEIRSNPELRQLKVFAVSGTEPRQLGVPIGSHGIDGWFPKPLDPQLLVKELTATECSAV